ncbi:MAG TPA: tol-pal system protein YbgF [Bryobacteraceae bacterium]|nr:tol-pal system protein YbgF [Bryobacteraceae bacterium]
MKTARLILLTALAAGASFGASREIVELQREVAALQAQIKETQRAIDTKLAALTTLVQQSLESSSKSSTSLTSLDAGIRERLADQQKTLVQPLATMSTKFDQMATDFQAVRDSVNDLNERINRMQAQLVDVSNTVKTVSAPPAPPPAGSSAVNPSTAPSADTTGQPLAPPPGLSAKQLYDSAMKDRSGGNFDLALQGFDEFLKYFGSTDLAPNAQFYIGQIHYDKADFQNALKAFDTVLERYPENNKTADAMYMKGMSLLRTNQRNAAATEFAMVIKRYPNSEVTVKARNQRKALGLGASPSAVAPPKRRGAE